MAREKKKPCPECHGQGVVDSGAPRPYGGYFEIPCPVCSETGFVPLSLDLEAMRIPAADMLEEQGYDEIATFLRHAATVIELNDTKYRTSELTDDARESLNYILKAFEGTWAGFTIQHTIWKSPSGSA